MAADEKKKDPGAKPRPGGGVSIRFAAHGNSATLSFC